MKSNSSDTRKAVVRNDPSASMEFRVMLVADTHGFVDPRIAGLASACDTVVHAGDVGSSRVLRSLRARRTRVLAVRGNNDTPLKWPASERALLRRLPRVLEIILPGGTVVVVHGDQILPASRRHALLRRRYPRARLIVYGHTHRLRYDRRTLPWVLNPGAAGRSRTHGGPSCAILNIGARAWRVEMRRFGENCG